MIITQDSGRKHNNTVNYVFTARLNCRRFSYPYECIVNACFVKRKKRHDFDVNDDVR